MKVGFVSIVGRPNAGKSTLINSIIGSKVAIVSDKAHTTRNNIQGIYNDDDSQIIFIDTPGIHKPMHKLGKYMNSQSYYSIEDTNVILFMVDATEKIGKGDKFILEKLKEVDSNVFLVLNKVDRIKKENLFPMIEEYNKLFDFKEIIPISALKKDNIDDLIKTIKKYLDEGERYYSEDYYTDKSINFMVSEIVREKVLNLTHEEVPHARRYAQLQKAFRRFRSRSSHHGSRNHQSRKHPRKTASHRRRGRRSLGHRQVHPPHGTTSL